MTFSSSPSNSQNDEDTISERSGDTRTRRHSRSHMHKHPDTYSLSTPATEFFHIPFGIPNATSTYSPSISSHSLGAPPMGFGSDSTLVRQPHSKHRRRKTFCRVLLGVTVSAILLSVIAVVSLAAYLGILTTKLDAAHGEVVHYEGSLRIVEGDDFSSLLLNKESEMFRETSKRYQRMIDAVYAGSNIQEAFIRSRVEGFQKGSVRVFFSVFLDRRKLPSHLSVSSKTVRDVLIQEAMAFEPVSFKSPIALDIDSIEIMQTKRQESTNPSRSSSSSFQRRVGDVEPNVNHLDTIVHQEESVAVKPHQPDSHKLDQGLKNPTSETKRVIADPPPIKVINNHESELDRDMSNVHEPMNHSLGEPEEGSDGNSAFGFSDDSQEQDEETLDVPDEIPVVEKPVQGAAGVTFEDSPWVPLLNLPFPKVVNPVIRIPGQPMSSWEEPSHRADRHPMSDFEYKDVTTFRPPMRLSTEVSSSKPIPILESVKEIRMKESRMNLSTRKPVQKENSNLSLLSRIADIFSPRSNSEVRPRLNNDATSGSISWFSRSGGTILPLDVSNLTEQIVDSAEPPSVLSEELSLIGVDENAPVDLKNATSNAEIDEAERVIGVARTVVLEPDYFDWSEDSSRKEPEDDSPVRALRHSRSFQEVADPSDIPVRPAVPESKIGALSFLSLLNGTAKITEASSSVEHHDMNKMKFDFDNIVPMRRPLTRPILYKRQPSLETGEPEILISSEKKGKPTNSPIYTFRLQEGQSAQDILGELLGEFSFVGSPLQKLQSELVALKEPLPSNSTTVATTTEAATTTTTTAATTTTVTTKAATTLKVAAKDSKKPDFPFPSRVRPSVLLALNNTKKGSKFWVVQSTTKANRLEETQLKKDIKKNNSIMPIKVAECDAPKFRCTSGECVPQHAKCNQMRDCSDGSDEQSCTCADFLKSQFLDRKLCDGIVDCPDYSDESQCDWCTSNGFICPGSKVCIPHSQICDGKRDCPFGEDERRCVTIANDDEQANQLSYSESGYLMVRREGRWGKLCADNLDNILTKADYGWKMDDLGKAVCKSLTYRKHDFVNRSHDSLPIGRRVDGAGSYYEMVVLDSLLGNSSRNEERPRAFYGKNHALDFQPSSCTKRDVIQITCKDLECGMRPRATSGRARRIVGGSNAGVGSWPWQAALYKDGDFQCGATLISDRWLMSAGHCFYHSTDSHWVARLGALRRGSNFISPYEQIRVISHVILHPGYRDIGFINDISLLRLSEPVKFTDYVRPVCLPSNDTNIEDGRMCTVVGWGQLYETGRVFPDTLQEVQLPLVSTEECRKRTLFLPLYQLNENMFCAGYDRGGRDACLGDSGGPLMCQEDGGNWQLYGVTSNGYGCARANRPGVYTKVSKYIPWIRQVMGASLPDRRLPKCSGHRCPLGDCLQANRVCNGILECSDGSDESDCPIKSR